MNHADIIALIKKIITKFLKFEMSIYMEKIDNAKKKNVLIDFFKELHRMRIIESYEQNYSIFWRVNEKDASNIANVLKLKMIDYLSKSNEFQTS